MLYILEVYANFLLPLGFTIPHKTMLDSLVQYNINVQTLTLFAQFEEKHYFRQGAPSLWVDHSLHYFLRVFGGQYSTCPCTCLSVGILLPLCLELHNGSAQLLQLCGPMDCTPAGFPVHGISQARIPEWVVISFSKGSFQSQESSQQLLPWLLHYRQALYC